MEHFAPGRFAQVAEDGGNVAFYRRYEGPLFFSMMYIYIYILNHIDIYPRDQRRSGTHESFSNLYGTRLSQKPGTHFREPNSIAR